MSVMCPPNAQGNFYTAISRLWELWQVNMWVIVPYTDDTFNFHLASVPSRINGRRHPSTLAWLTSTQMLFKTHFQRFLGGQGQGICHLVTEKRGLQIQQSFFFFWVKDDELTIF